MPVRSQKARETAWTGMLFALAIALSYLESLVSPLLGLMPAIKLGLSNIVVMYALLFLRTHTALLLVVLKALFAFLTRGATAGFLSLCGGALSLAVMLVLLQLPASNFKPLNPAGQRVYLLCRFGAGPQSWAAGRGRRAAFQCDGTGLRAGAAGGRADRGRHQLHFVPGAVCCTAEAGRAAAPGESVSKIRIFLKFFILPIDIYAYMPYNKAIDTGMCPRSNYKITGGNSYD
jgi:hypothetical protein